MRQKAFTLLEILIVIAIIVVITTISLQSYVSLRKSQGLKADVQNIASLLGQARSQTLSSKNASVYGVNFASTTVTLFAGTTYTPGNSGNSVYSLTPHNVVTTNLPGGTTAVLFNRITGETNQSNTVTATVTSETASSTINVYKTGVIETP
jgi:prepilin-type N-terminal cleavage/methylation domain-containing protein